MKMGFFLTATIFSCNNLQNIADRIINSMQLNQTQINGLVRELKKEYPGCSLNVLSEVKQLPRSTTK